MFSAFLLLTSPEAGAPFPASLAGCGNLPRPHVRGDGKRDLSSHLSEHAMIVTDNLVFPCDGAAQRTCKEHWAVDC